MDKEIAFKISKHSIVIPAKAGISREIGGFALKNELSELERSAS
ncbi:MAG: hypothetical protein AAF228_07715 [Pseudomonadota bacterium]